ncbi:putative 40S ribosomal protein S3 [Paratrimastix pyriformis]|uniref:40S ribosomal protein S3 n=1 Tax=Paratrimastix pyriformis TaxID=342808 RepID=A0ABQ8ULE9_9EUKA|nr:putative 40S ribosomal protein S3 [Paratrimastix pyriformis]
MSAAIVMNKKRKFIADGVFFAELNEFLEHELNNEGYAGLELRVIPGRTEITIRATRTQAILGDKGHRIRELTAVIQKRFNFQENTIRLLAEKLNNRGLSATAQAESLCYKLVGGLPVRRACYGVVRFIMDNGAKGCEVRVSGKLRGLRAKAMKFRDGYMIKSGQPAKEMITRASRSVDLEQGILGVCVKIMLPSRKEHPDGKDYLQPDVVTVLEPKADESISPDKVKFASHPNPAYAVPAPVAAPAPAPVAAPAPAPVAAPQQF